MPTAYEKPLPRVNPDTKPFWDGCREHTLRLQKCMECDLVRWPPSMICPGCHSARTEWITAVGTGTVYTYAVYHRAFDKSFKEDLPYVTAVVRLAEGPHLLTNIIGCKPEDVRCDMPVEVVWEDVTGEFSLPRFRPVL